ncbi:MAG: FAD-binding protein [Bacteroidales bacterium]|nr:FAD-binding protein [Bacteroidales bacterium]
METNKLEEKLNHINIKGDIFTDLQHLVIYATDASAYREMPQAVMYPKDKEDLKAIILWANSTKTALIPRAAGTSLAGQVVGSGVIVDMSKYFTRIIEINEEKGYAIIEPGVVRDELNLFLKDKGLFFSPETSTSNRCNIGGMVGNNSCGAHSLVYGSTREHTLEVKGFLSDASEVHFKPIFLEDFKKKTKGIRLENKIYQHIDNLLSDKDNQQEIRSQFPDIRNKRRNTGYAIDLLLESEPFEDTPIPFNFSKLIAGSEGTLVFITELKVRLTHFPPPVKGLVCVHLNSVSEAIRANLIALQFNPCAIELMDKVIMDLSKENITQQKNRFFIQGDPGAMLMVEFDKNSREEIEEVAKNMENAMREAYLGYHFPLITGKDISKVWEVRKAGLGLLSNMKGDAKPVPVIEDTAILPEHLEDYINDFEALLEKHKLSCVYYAHIATGEIHLRPVLNLKLKKDQELFRTIALDVAKLVKKYNGSLSGEHGDGRLRGEFIPLMMGDRVYQMFKDIKQTWDPNGIFNPGKIVNTPPMNAFLRYEPDQPKKTFETIFDFSKDGGWLEAAEKCNGSGDCRKSHLMGGTMCPSYQASKNESQTTRARANTLREFLTRSKKAQAFDHQEIYDVMDLCLSCKACKSECPSNVDVTKLKAEFLQHYYDIHGVPLRSKLIANIAKINAFGMRFKSLTNFFLSFPLSRIIIQKSIGFSTHRTMPLLAKQSLEKYIFKLQQNEGRLGTVYLFNDEFTNFNDSDIGITAIRLLNRLGYKVIVPQHVESGRTYLSKGLLRKAQSLAIRNVELLKDKINEQTPLLGIEPSAILSFRDEYPELVGGNIKQAAQQLATNALLIDEFLAQEIKKGNIKQEQFTEAALSIKLHGHCQQKAVASTEATKQILSFPLNYQVEEIPSGCCGMAGSFGYEKEHYELSMKIGELILFPSIRKTDLKTVIAANGTSCRHQIKDGTKREALHPISILYQALK